MLFKPILRPGLNAKEHTDSYFLFIIMQESAQNVPVPSTSSNPSGASTSTADDREPEVGVDALLSLLSSSSSSCSPKPRPRLPRMLEHAVVSSRPDHNNFALLREIEGGGVGIVAGNSRRECNRDARLLRSRYISPPKPGFVRGFAHRRQHAHAPQGLLAGPNHWSRTGTAPYEPSRKLLLVCLVALPNSSFRLAR